MGVNQIQEPHHVVAEQAARAVVGKHVVEQLPVVRLGTAFEQQTREWFGAGMRLRFFLATPEHTRQG
jgi:hypothetical protein